MGFVQNPTHFNYIQGSWPKYVKISAFSTASKILQGTDNFLLTTEDKFGKSKRIIIEINEVGSTKHQSSSINKVEWKSTYYWFAKKINRKDIKVHDHNLVQSPGCWDYYPKQSLSLSILCYVFWVYDFLLFGSATVSKLENDQQDRKMLQWIWMSSLMDWIIQHR